VRRRTRLSADVGHHETHGIFPDRAKGCGASAVRKHFADRSPWREPELTLAVKLLYLARLREYDPLSSDAEAERVLGSAVVSAEVFDRWWSIRRIEFDTPEEMHDFLSRVVQKVPSTGNVTVDEWLRRVTSR
jgi:hypothetical protein